MRGKLTPAAVDQYGNGITPADAGKTAAAIVRQVCKEDHPRGCGENLLGFVNQAVAVWITPADAGKTQTGTPFGVFLRDHPRGCGENILVWTDEDVWEGSPPRMRGKLGQRRCGIADAGITPADAGKTIKKAR